jgi:hypothetical protein
LIPVILWIRLLEGTISCREIELTIYMNPICLLGWTALHHTSELHTYKMREKNEYPETGSSDKLRLNSMMRDPRAPPDTFNFSNSVDIILMMPIYILLFLESIDMAYTPELGWPQRGTGSADRTIVIYDTYT